MEPSIQDGKEPQEERQTVAVSAALGSKHNKLNRVTFSTEVDKDQNDKAQRRLKIDEEKKVGSSSQSISST